MIAQTSSQVDSMEFETIKVRREFQELTQAAMKRGFQTRAAEMDLGRLVSHLKEHSLGPDGPA